MLSNVRKPPRRTYMYIQSNRDLSKFNSTPSKAKLDQERAGGAVSIPRRRLESGMM
jgi:hypothetical protein